MTHKLTPEQVNELLSLPDATQPDAVDQNLVFPNWYMPDEFAVLDFAIAVSMARIGQATRWGISSEGDIDLREFELQIGNWRREDSES